MPSSRQGEQTDVLKTTRLSGVDKHSSAIVDDVDMFDNQRVIRRRRRNIVRTFVSSMALIRPTGDIVRRRCLTDWKCREQRTREGGPGMNEDTGHWRGLASNRISVAGFKRSVTPSTGQIRAGENFRSELDSGRSKIDPIHPRVSGARRLTTRSNLSVYDQEPVDSHDAASAGLQATDSRFGLRYAELNPLTEKTRTYSQPEYGMETRAASRRVCPQPSPDAGVQAETEHIDWRAELSPATRHEQAGGIYGRQVGRRRAEKHSCQC
ncbi:hypothetical protein DPEC_G00298340 [Dallia pectoralis]|uniref:Uncharacterized protein n=1 Tax=Dallia pectoralis TaxID=75939 RepID=A0ACC2FFT6_DALPE|nr:hypothetical protein DPEC_G00298340 [Dallia pectoralis]